MQDSVCHYGPLWPQIAAEKPTIVVVVTHPQTCLVLPGRLRALGRAGFRVILVASPGELLEKTAEQAGVERVAIPMERGMAPLADLVSLIRLIWLLLRVHPDVLECSTPKAGLLGLLAGFVCRVPRRVYVLRGLRLETVQGGFRRILLAAERAAAASAHAVLCNSQSLRARALALGVAPDRKLHLLGEGSSNGVDVNRFSPGPSAVRAALHLPDAAPVVGFVGRLTRDKGLPELLDAFEEMLRTTPEARLLLVGWFDASEDALDEAMRARILGHPRIHVTGYVKATAPYYRAMQVMVLPTWREGFPNAVLEAAATGIPVVTTWATGSRDSVVPEVTGVLIPPGEPEAIRAAVVALLRDVERRERMGRAARAWVCEHYPEERVQALAVAYYRGLVAPKRVKATVAALQEVS